MKHLAAAAIAIIFLAQPSLAQEREESERLLPNEEEMRELGELAQEFMLELTDRMAPMAERLRDMVDDLDAYEAPEMLPNGDIIIRRKPNAPPAAEESDDSGAIDL